MTPEEEIVRLRAMVGDLLTAVEEEHPLPTEIIRKPIPGQDLDIYASYMPATVQAYYRYHGKVA